MNAAASYGVPSGKPAWAIAAAVGMACAGAVLAASGKDARWAVGLPAITMAGFLFAVVPKKENVCLFLFFFLLPVALNFYPLFLSLKYTAPVRGIPIYAYDLPLVVIFSLWLARIATGAEKIRFPVIPSALFLCAFVLTMYGMIKAPQSLSMQASILWAQAKCCAVFLFASNYLADPSRRKLAAAAVLLSLVPQAMVGFLQATTGASLGLSLLGEMQNAARVTLATGTATRIGGLVGSMNQFAIYLGMTLPLAVACMFARRPPLPRLRVLLPLLLAGIVLDMLTFSRGGWISLTIGIAVAAFLSLSRRMKSWLLAALLVAGGGVAVGGTAIAVSEPVQQRLFGNDGGAASSRASLIQISLEMIKQNSAAGVGYGNFLRAARTYDGTRNAITYAFPYPVHNEYLLLAAELGVPLLVLFLLMLAAAAAGLVRGVQKAKDPDHALLCCGLAGCLAAWSVHQLFEWAYVFTNTNFWAFLGFCYGAARLDGKNGELS